MLTPLCLGNLQSGSQAVELNSMNRHTLLPPTTRESKKVGQSTLAHNFAKY